MSTVSITTSNNVDIEYEIANIGDRILALTVDYLILSGYYLLTGVATYFLSKTGISPGLAYSLIVFAVPVFLYDLLCEIFLNGQSFGKRIKQIKVIKLDGSQPSVWDYIIRWILRLVDISLFFGTVAIITIAANGKGQRLGDIAAGTTVVRTKKSTGFQDTIFTKVDSDYKPVFPEAASLGPETVLLIREVINSGQTLNPKVFIALTQKTKSAVEKKLGINSALDAPVFLTTVLKDYNYFSR